MEEKTVKEETVTAEGATMLAAVLPFLAIGQAEAKCYSLPTMQLGTSQRWNCATSSVHSCQKLDRPAASHETELKQVSSNLWMTERNMR